MLNLDIMMPERNSTLAILLNGVCTQQANTFGQRLFLQVIVLITMVLTNAYSGQLLGFFAAPPHYDNPGTLDEAVSATRHLYSDKDYNFVMGNEDASDAMRKFLLKFSVDTDLLTRLHSIVQSRNDAYLLTHDRYLQYMMYKNLTSNGKHLLYQVPECMITPGNVGYPVTKNIPEYDVLNQFTMRVLEGGLYGLRAIRERNQLTAQGVLIPSSSQRSEPQAMTLDQFSASLIVLTVGLGVSSVAFFTELLRFHLQISCVFCYRNTYINILN
ncbi:Ionotropic receptor 874 [Gryllus bimaculatus]|nr:Ionotropic receptor 874 [Gryllus bimaculatus]